MTKPCIPSYGYNDKIDKTYANVNNKNGITTQKELLSVCGSCQKYLCCDTVLRLFTLLSVNDAPKETR